MRALVESILTELASKEVVIMGNTLIYTEGLMALESYKVLILSQLEYLSTRINDKKSDFWPIVKKILQMELEALVKC